MDERYFMGYEYFFRNLNENIKNSTTERSLKNMERIGENYVKNILKNKNISNVVKNNIRKEMKMSKKLIQKKRKEIKK